MKKLILATLVVTIGYLLPGPDRVSAQEKPPTKGELEKMMQELDPEAREMMKQMGIAVPDIGKLGTALSGSYEAGGNRSAIPAKDPARIAVAKKTILKESDLSPYLAKVHAAVTAKLGSQPATDAREMYGMAGSAAEGAQIANGLWMFGSTAYAILLLGNTLQSDPLNADYLNNYAAFLTMAGAEEAAIPILKYLNAIHPQNSTVLNNLAQAWFGLGDIPTAEAYLDSTLGLYPGHSQANLTKSVIEEQKGNKTEAVKALKESIRSGYSSDKEARIKALGHKVTGRDITWTTDLNEDPLGFGHMNWPDYPMNVTESGYLEGEWENYRSEISRLSAKYQQEFAMAQNEYALTIQERTIELLSPQANLHLPKKQMVFSSKIAAKMEYYDHENPDLELQRYEEQLANRERLSEMVREKESQYQIALEQFVKTAKDGEGAGSADMNAYCEARDNLSNNYLTEVNTLLRDDNKKWIDHWRFNMGRRLNYLQYTLWPEEFELEKLRAMITWLAMIGGQEVRFASPCERPEEEEMLGLVSGKLQDFYDINCKEVSRMNLFIGSVTIECNKMTTQLDSKFFKYTVRENMDTDQIIQGSVEIGFDPNLSDPVAWGPVKAELKGELYGFIEFDGNGITDVGVKAGAKATFGTNYVSDENAKASLGFADDLSATLVGAEARWGWNSGPSMEGKGILQGISTTFK